MASSSSADAARATFELANDIEAVDSVFHYDADEQRVILDAKPWKDDPHHFKRVRVSAVALIKMVMHARSGGAYEIMGLMQGKVDGDTMVVMDAFALPVTGTETRVNAQNEANEFMIQYIESSKKIGRLENVIGWYHSHPGYGCWLSGIDVQTQMTHQTWEDPFLAVVIDPNRTISAGRVDIGAFRTYPEGYTPPSAGASDHQAIPLSKIEDFGVHANAYYPLEISHFKSSSDAKLLELLWNKYWVMTLSQSPLVSNRAFATSQIGDLVEKVSRAGYSVAHRCSVSAICPAAVAVARSSSDKAGSSPGGGGGGKAASAAKRKAATSTKSKSKDSTDAPAGNETEVAKADETPLAKAVRESNKISSELSQGLVGALVKDALFCDARLGGVSRTGEGGDLKLPPLS